jgi:hypothetical protein
MRKWKQATKPFPLRNPQKYLGDIRQLKYKSSWEEEAFKVCDNNPYILEWGYEIIDILYVIPSIKTMGKLQVKKYKPDLYVVVQNENGTVNKKLIEIKPFKQTKKSRSRNPRIKLQEDYIHGINTLKWNAAVEWCKERNIEFLVVTERELFGNRTRK